MNKSFKWHVFLRLLVLTFFIILVNRQFAQQLLRGQLQQASIETMGRALRSCSSSATDEKEFVKCSKNLNLGMMISSEMDFYVLCHATQTTTQPDSNRGALCAKANAPNLMWRTDKSGIERAELVQDQVKWQLIQWPGAAQPTKLLMQQNHMDQYMDEVWALRDRNLFYVIPSIILLLTLMALYMVRVLLAPIRKIEDAVAALDSKSLNQSIGVPTPFKEFQTFIAVFEDFRQRLEEGFTKARRFASDASHELRTPLAILRGNSEQLIATLPTGSSEQVRASRMNEEIDRLIEITEKLLMLSRADANSIVEDNADVDVSALLAELIDEADSLQTQVRVSGDIQPQVVCWGDRTLIRQLIHNLYSNALNYNVVNGWIHIRLTAQDGSFDLEIENPSTNTPADLSQRAFERFYRGDASHTRQVDGIGLGLSLCAEIAKLHQGTLTLQVTGNDTVRVRFHAPLTRQSAPV